MEYNIGDKVRTKKQHPCGSKEWKITRVGVDFKLECLGCGKVVVLPREKAIKAIREVNKDVIIMIDNCYGEVRGVENVIN